MTRVSIAKHLKERCATIREALLDARIVTAEEVKAIWPGAPDNHGRGVHAWLYTYFNLARFSARAEARQEFTHGASDARSDALIELQQGTARAVKLAVPLTIDGATVDTLHLHHKSFVALRRMATYARIGTNLLHEAQALEADIALAPDAADLLVEVHEWRARILLMLIWAATTEGPGLPWNPATEKWPTVPVWLEQLDSTDGIAVHLAYTEQYARAMLAIAPFLAPDEDGKDPLGGWETFFASYATEKGLEAQALMSDRAFQPFLTQVTLAGHSARQARESAKQAAENGAPPGAT